MLSVLHDARYAIRLIRQRPGFTGVAVLTLGIGVGAATAIFTVVNAVLLTPLPFPDSDRLVDVRIVAQDGEVYPLPNTDFIAWRDLNRTADAVAVYSAEAATLTGEGDAERLFSLRVTDRWFDVLAVRPLLGRTLRQGDDAPAAAKTAVLSYSLWMRRYRGDAGAVGRSIVLNGEIHTVVGVMPPDFRFGDANVDVWRVLTMDPPLRRGPFYTNGIARLGRGAGLSQLRANLAEVASAIKRQYPAPDTWRLDAIPLKDARVGDVRTVLYALFGAVAFLLLIATTNVANLLLARATSRDREIAVRGALGAARSRLVAQLVTESVVLSMFSAAIGLAIAVWATHALVAMAPAGIPRLAEVRVNGRVFAFAVLAATACGVLFGLAPALRAAGTSVAEALKTGGRGGAPTRQRRTQQVLIVTEIALALMLSVGAGLMIRSFAALQRVSPGFEPSHLLTFRLTLPRVSYDTGDKVRAFYASLVDRLGVLPGVRAVALTISLPPHLLQMTDNFMTEGMALPPNQSAPVGPLVFVSEEFFNALGAPLIRGRFFTPGDDRSAPEVAIINQTLARRYFPGADPVGRRIRNGGPERPDNSWMTIVGVVGDIAYSGLDAPPEPTVYLPFRQTGSTAQFVVLRSSVDPASLAAPIREAVASLDRNVPVPKLSTMDQLLAESVAPPRFRTILVTMFAVVGILLAWIGIFGVMAYAVAERRHEIGLRAALGAAPGDLLSLVLREAMALAGAGVAAGLAGAWVTTRLIRALLFRVEPTDAATFAAISALVLATALAASYLPARRALAVDPAIALRDE